MRGSLFSGFLLLILLSVYGEGRADRCGSCSSQQPPGVEGFNKDEIRKGSDGCLVRNITCFRPNYVKYHASEAIVSQADPSLEMKCNAESQWVTPRGHWVYLSVDCHNSTRPKKSKEVCQLKHETGRCRAFFPMLYFDKETKECKPFVYGGCGGTENRFWTKEECESTCL